MKKLAICGIIMLLTACRPEYEETYSFTGDKWDRFEQVNYQAVLEHPGEYDISLTLIYSEEAIRDQSFSLSLSFSTPYQEERYREQEAQIFENGEATGKPVKEGYYQIEIPFFRAVNLKEKGVYEFDVDNLMSRYTSQGIHKLKLNLNPV
ncbi:MAG: hypothetical protein R6U19_07570 [Bacteroidales bacterium]